MDKELLVTQLNRILHNATFYKEINRQSIDHLIALLDQYIEYKVIEAILSHERDTNYHE